MFSILKCNLFLWFQSWVFSIVTPVTWSFRNHSNNMIYCSNNIFYYYYYVEDHWVEFFQVYFMNRKFRRTAFIWNRNLLYHSINVFIIFDLFKASLLNKSINFYNIYLIIIGSPSIHTESLLIKIILFLYFKIYIFILTYFSDSIFIEQKLIEFFKISRK